jgi:hypothetical protein
MDDRAEKKRYKRLELVEKNRKAQLDEYVKVSMNLPQGRTFFFWLLELAGIGQNPFTANALTTSFKCGELNIGQQILAQIIEVAPADYLKMLREKEEERINANGSSTDNRDDSFADPGDD